MEKDEQLFDKIETYLRGEMSPAEVADFEQEMANDPALASEVDIQRLEHDAMELILENELRADMQEWAKTPPSVGKNRRLWLWVLAAIALAVVILLFFIPPGEPAPNQEQPEQKTSRDADMPIANDKPTNPTEEAAPSQQNQAPNTEPRSPQVPANQTNPEYLALATDTYKLPVGMAGGSRGGTKGTTEGSNGLLNTGIDLFGKGEYKESIITFNKINKSDENYSTALKYKAHALYATRQFPQAVAAFRELLTAAEAQQLTSSIDEYEWYLLLSLLPNYTQNKAQADALIEKMLNPPGGYHSYTEQAEALNTALEKIR